MDDLKSIIGKVATGATPRATRRRPPSTAMMSGEATPSQMGGLLMALRVRGETVEEITGAVATMRGKMLRVKAPAEAVDIVGTGGDGSGSVNVSTCAAFIVAGAGVPVAKHGNRALSSRSGVGRRAGLARCQDRFDAGPGRAAASTEAGIGFMFAPGASSGDEERRPDPRRARHPHHLQPARTAVEPRRRSSGRWSACSRGSGCSRWRRC